MRSRSLILTALMPLSVSLLVVACGGGNEGSKKTTATKAPANPNETANKAKTDGRASSGASLDVKNLRTVDKKAEAECALNFEMKLSEGETKVELKSLKDNQSGTWQLVETQTHQQMRDANSGKTDTITGESAGVVDSALLLPKADDQLAKVVCFNQSLLESVLSEAEKGKTEEKTEVDTQKQSEMAGLEMSSYLPNSIDRKTGMIEQFRRDTFLTSGGISVKTGVGLTAAQKISVEKLPSSYGSNTPTVVVSTIGNKLIIRIEIIAPEKGKKTLIRTVRMRGVYEAK